MTTTKRCKHCIPFDMTVGSVFETNSCGALEVIQYNGRDKITVKFLETGYTTLAAAGQIRGGRVSDKLKRTLCEVGFTGDGIYTTKTKGHKKAYNAWSNMIKRCYNKKLQDYGVIEN